MSLIKFTLDSEPIPSYEVRRTFHYEEQEDRVYIESHQDVEPVLKSNANWRGWSDGYNSDKSMRRVARIPMVVIEKIMKEHGFDPLKSENSDRLLQLLDQPEYAYLRCSEGVLSRKPLRQYFHGKAKPRVEIRPSEGL